MAHPTLRELIATIRLDPGVEATLRMSVATGEIAARWDRTKGAVGDLPPEVQRGSAAVIREDVGGHRLRVSIGSFFQSGPQAAALLVAAVRRAAPELDTAAVVVDAYAGVGMFAVCAASPESYVVAVETSRSAVADAEENLNARRHEIVRGEVGGWRAPADLGAEVVVADPARSGLGAPGTAALARLDAPVLVLVSCDPGSLGRDAKLLGRAGYAHERSEVIDTFPQTTHIEVVSRFTRVEAPEMLSPFVSPEVRAALDAGGAVVALESTIFSNLGLPSPANAEALDRCLAAVRATGAIPAVTAVLDGVARVGLNSD